MLCPGPQRSKRVPGAQVGCSALFTVGVGSGVLKEGDLPRVGRGLGPCRSGAPLPPLPAWWRGVEKGALRAPPPPLSLAWGLNAALARYGGGGIRTMFSLNYHECRVKLMSVAYTKEKVLPTATWGSVAWGKEASSPSTICPAILCYPCTCFSVASLLVFPCLPMTVLWGPLCCHFASIPPSAAFCPDHRWLVGNRLPLN